jgi:hypothetical protein
MAAVPAVLPLKVFIVSLVSLFIVVFLSLLKRIASGAGEHSRRCL